MIKGIIMQNPGGKRLANSKSGLKIVSSRSCDTSPWELAEPQWVLDSEVNLNNFGATRLHFYFHFKKKIFYRFRHVQNVSQNSHS